MISSTARNAFIRTIRIEAPRADAIVLALMTLLGVSSMLAFDARTAIAQSGSSEAGGAGGTAATGGSSDTNSNTGSTGGQPTDGASAASPPASTASPQAPSPAISPSTVQNTDVPHLPNPTPGGRAPRGSGNVVPPGDAGGLDASEARAPNSISDEPNRVRRGGSTSGKALEDCMRNWDPGTHMTKAQWRTTCERLGR